MPLWPTRPGAAQGQVEDGPQVVLELAGDGPLDGPVAGVVHAGRHLVGDQAAAVHEELDRQNAGVTKVSQHAAQVAGRRALPAAPGRRGRA